MTLLQHTLAAEDGGKERGVDMNDNDIHQPVAVGTDGTAAALRGVQFAAVEAQRLGVRLEIIHVSPGFLPERAFPMVPDGAFRAFEDDVFDRSRGAA